MRRIIIYPSGLGAEQTTWSLSFERATCLKLRLEQNSPCEHQRSFLVVGQRESESVDSGTACTQNRI